MQTTQITLGVFYDGQFFTALFERKDDCGYSAARQVFGAEPKDSEVYKFILDNYYMISYSKPVKDDSYLTKKIGNPKRMQREAAKALNKTGFSTKAQEAIKLQHEENKKEKISNRSDDKALKEEFIYELRAKKRKDKHKGR